MNRKSLHESRLIANALENILTGKNPYYKDRAGNDPEFFNHVSMALTAERSLMTYIAG